MCASDRRHPGALALTLALAFGAASLAPQAAWAQSKKEQEQVRRLRQQVQQLQQQQQAVQDEAQKSAQQKAELESQLKKSRGEIDDVKSRASSAARRLAAATQEADSLRSARDALQTERVATTGLILQDAAYADLDARNRATSSRLDTCTVHNAELYKLGDEILARYRNKGFGEMLATQEPFVQARRVALENLVEDYRDKLDQARLPPTAAGPAAR